MPFHASQHKVKIPNSRNSNPSLIVINNPITPCNLEIQKHLPQRWPWLWLWFSGEGDLGGALGGDLGGVDALPPKLEGRMPNQLSRDLEGPGCGDSGRRMPCSTSKSFVEDWLPEPSSSSSLSSVYASYRGEVNAPPRLRERTTSPLQIGQVRRRVVSQGVLFNIS